MLPILPENICNQICTGVEVHSMNLHVNKLSDSMCQCTNTPVHFNSFHLNVLVPFISCAPGYVGNPQERVKCRPFDGKSGQFTRYHCPEVDTHILIHRCSFSCMHDSVWRGVLQSFLSNTRYSCRNRRYEIWKILLPGYKLTLRYVYIYSTKHLTGTVYTWYWYNITLILNQNHPKHK